MTDDLRRWCRMPNAATAQHWEIYERVDAAVREQEEKRRQDKKEKTDDDKT